MNQELWRDIAGYEGKYQVSNLGNVKSLNFLNTGKEGLLSPWIDSTGYLKVNFYKDGKRKIQYVHRLVCEAFVENDDPENKKQINHISEVKTDNRVENLEWISQKDNINYGTRNERAAKTLSKPVYCVELDRVFESGYLAAEELKINHQGISRCCTGRGKTYLGKHWRYATDEEIIKYELKRSFDELTDAIVAEARIERMGAGYNVPGLLESAC